MIDFEEMQAEAERLASEGNNENEVLEKYVMFPPRDGVVTVRLLPPAPGQNKPFCATRIHRINDRNVHCPRVLKPGDKYYTGDCEICSYYSYLWKLSEEDGITEDEKKRRENTARKFKPTERYYYNCIVREYHNPKTKQTEINAGPKILSIGKKLHDKIVVAFVGNPKFKKKPKGDVTNVDTGFDFQIVKKMVQSGRDEWANYDESNFDSDPSEAGTKEEVAKWLSTLHNLQELRVLKSQEELEQILALHLGKIKNPKNNFDMGKYDRMASAQPRASVEEVIRQEVARTEAAVQSAAVPAATPAVPPELSTEEFFKTLNNMGGK